MEENKIPIHYLLSFALHDLFISQISIKFQIAHTIQPFFKTNFPEKIPFFSSKNNGFMKLEGFFGVCRCFKAGLYAAQK